MKRGGIFGEEEDGILEPGPDANLIEPEFKQVSIGCDEEGSGDQDRCEERLYYARPLGLTEEADFIRARARGWLVDGDKTYCPKHAPGHERLVTPEEAHTIGEEVRADFHAAVDECAAIGRKLDQISSPPATKPGSWSRVLVLALVIVIIGLVMALGMTWSRILVSESRLISFMMDDFEARSHIARKDCGAFFATERFCSGVIKTEGQLDVPARYSCDRDHCRFEFGK